MISSKPTRFSLCVIITAAMVGVPFAQGPQPADNGKNPVLLARELAALQAFRALLASHSYEHSENELRTMLKDYLKKNNTDKEPPYDVPKVKNLESSLSVDFQSDYNAMIRQATSGLDPDGKLGLEKRFTEYLAKHGRLREEAQKRHKQYVESRLGVLVKRVTAQMVKEQIDALHEALVAHVKRGNPTNGQIEAAFQANFDSIEKVDACTEQLRKLSNNLRVSLHEDRGLGT